MDGVYVWVDVSVGVSVEGCGRDCGIVFSILSICRCCGMDEETYFGL